MKKILSIFLAFSASLILFGQYASAVSSWSVVGTAGFSAGSSTYTSLSLDSNNIPYVAYRDGGNSNKASVMKYVSGSWQVVGTAGFSAGAVDYTSLALDSTNTPYIAYKDAGSSNKTTVMKYNGTSWQVVGTAGFSAGTADNQSLAIASTGVPYVAYRDGANNNRATVMKYNGTSWQVVGVAGFTAGTYAGEPSIALDSSNLPYVAYTDGSVTNKMSVMKYNGTSWGVVGATGISPSYAYGASLKIDSTNTPYVAYRDDGNSGKATVKKYASGSWQTVGTAGFSAGTATSTSLAFDSSNTPYLAYTDYGTSTKATVMKYVSGSWQAVGTAGFSSGAAVYTSLAFSTSGVPYVAYQDAANSNKITVQTYVNTNSAPTALSLSATSLAENVAANTAVGTLSATDPDSGDTFTYSLVSGTGDDDNASFNISGSSLRISNSPDFEAKSSYSVRLRVTDAGGLTYEKAFTVSVTNVNEAPTNLSLSSASVNENVAANTSVGTLSSTDPDSGNTFTYSLVTGTGDTDNASFNISGDSLRITNSPDFEAKSSYSVRVRTTDQGGLTYEKAFTVSVTNVNEAPTALNLSSTTINENVATNTSVGTLSATDPDTGSTFSYSLVTGTGDTDNASFNISGNSLRITNSPDYETKASYSVRMSVSDGTNTYEKSFAITVSDVNEAPDSLTLSNTNVDENTDVSTTVGTLSATDPDVSPAFTYNLVSGTGNEDNTDFTITGDKLYFAATPNYESPNDTDGNNSYNIRVQVSDGTNTYEKAFIVTVADVNEVPTNLSPATVTVSENTTAAVWTPSVTDPDATNTFSYQLVSGTGDEDNAQFAINSTTGALTFTAAPDYENPADATNDNSYQVRVQVTNSGLTYSQAITINVLNMDDPDSVVINNAETTNPIKIVTPDSTTINCDSVMKEADNTKQDTNYDYPVGLVDFCFTTSVADNEVTVTFVTDKKAADVVLRKYNPDTQKYATVSGATLTDVTYNGQAAVQAVYTITDNGELDLDAATGSIQDPVGLAVAVNTNSSGNTGGSTGGSTGATDSGATTGSSDSLASTGTNIAVLAASSIALLSLGALTVVKLRRI